MPDITDTPYPIWTTQVGNTTTAAAGGCRTRDLSLTALSEILGRRVNKDDPQGIARALTERFTIARDANGTSSVTWNSNGSRVQINRSGISALTGAQRSLVDRAQTLVDRAKQQLAGLEPLVFGTEKSVESIYAIVGPELDELVEQFAAEGGPVPQRVDHLLDLLVNYDPTVEPLPRIKADTVRGQLGVLRGDLGIDPARVNTVEDELAVTNFQTLVAYLDSIRTMWHHERPSFDRNNDGAYLGTHTVLIERALTCVAQSLRETEFALDSVFVTPDDRASLTAKIDGIDVTFSEIFSWIEDVATEDGFDAIRLSGKDGLEFRLAPTLRRLANVVSQTICFIDADRLNGSKRTLPAAFGSSRVMTALDELHKHLAKASERADEVKRPTLQPPRKRQAKFLTARLPIRKGSNPHVPPHRTVAPVPPFIGVPVSAGVVATQTPAVAVPAPAPVAPNAAADPAAAADPSANPPATA